VTALAIIGGLDPTGGAGLLRDAWTAAPELELLAACTALTRQGGDRPATYVCTAPATLARQLERIAAHPQLRAVKLGMVPSGQVEAVAELLARLRAREGGRRPMVVCDPVIRASDGGQLGAERHELLELAARVDLLTPNRAEQAELAAAGPLPSICAVLFKGEEVRDHPDRIRDRLRHADGRELIFERPRVDGPDPRGTGCALATAIASELARGRSLTTAVAAGIAWLDGARRQLHRGSAGSWFLPGKASLLL
jgi:hydroxymethylpyrimidine/phosphomethylpyrimidine kinase